MTLACQMLCLISLCYGSVLIEVFVAPGIRVVSNAGGINPLACAAAVREAARKADVDIKVAVVTGDDIISQVSYY